MVGQDVFNCINKSKQIAYIELPPFVCSKHFKKQKCTEKTSCNCTIKAEITNKKMNETRKFQKLHHK